MFFHSYFWTGVFGKFVARGLRWFSEFFFFILLQFVVLLQNQRSFLLSPRPPNLPQIFECTRWTKWCDPILFSLREIYSNCDFSYINEKLFKLDLWFLNFSLLIKFAVLFFQKKAIEREKKIKLITVISKCLTPNICTEN